MIYIMFFFMKLKYFCQGLKKVCY